MGDGAIEFNHHERFIITVAFGFGLLLATGVGLLPSAIHSHHRSAMACSVGLLAVGFLEHLGGGIALHLLIVSAIAIGLPAIGVGFGSWVFRKIRQSSLRSVMSCSAGVSMIALGQWNYQREENEAFDQGTGLMEPHTWRPQPAPRPAVIAKTDCGSKIPLERVESQTRDRLNNEERTVLNSGYRESIIRREPATDDCNCHGWVFTGGKYWVSGNAVDRILADNGYEIIDDPQPGDLVIYREVNSPTHTAIVRYVTPGLPVLVEGKWSWMGVFLHPVDQSAYGKIHSYYRSSRSNHLLACIPDEEEREVHNGE